jgi:hypothetical protein
MVPVNTTKSYMFGDNQAVAKNVQDSYNKKHNPLSYHRVMEMMAANILGYYWIDGKNPADVVSKHWGHQQVSHFLKPLLFFSVDTDHILDDGEEDNEEVNKNI